MFIAAIKQAVNVMIKRATITCRIFLVFIIQYFRINISLRQPEK